MLQDYDQETEYFRPLAPNLSVADVITWYHGQLYCDILNDRQPLDREKTIQDLKDNFLVFWHQNGVLYARRFRQNPKPAYNNFSYKKIKAIRTHEWNEELGKWYLADSFVAFKTVSLKHLAKLIKKAKKPKTRPPPVIAVAIAIPKKEASKQIPAATRRRSTRLEEAKSR